MTQTGYIGLCPRYTWKGDLVHSVLGLGVSLILTRETAGPLHVRGVLDPNKRYILSVKVIADGITNKIGDCNIDSELVTVS